MPSFRSNLNSISSTCERLITLKNQITTCFQHCYRNFVQPKQPTSKPDSNNTDYGEEHQAKHHWLQLKSLKDYENLEKTNKNLQHLKGAISTNFQVAQRETYDSKKYEIIAKLLSSTLIATRSKDNSTETAQESSSNVANNNNNKMTILEDTFMLIREEHPDLDLEIRSILMSYAQSGATIGQIKEDYRKNTGTTFPVFDHITDFLLCIPGVMAFCTERGTRLFSVQPTEKTKHIYDMIMNQRAPWERGPPSVLNRHFTHPRDSGFSSFRSAPPPAPACCHSTNLCYPRDQGFATQPPLQHQEPLHNIEDPNVHHESDNYEADKRNGYYRDNCQYLISRIYNGCDQNKPSNNFTVNENNFANEMNNLNINNNANENVVPQTDDVNSINEQENQQFSNQPTQNDQDVFKRPIGRAVRAIHHSSPSGTRSSQTNDSLFSADTDGEARLLDFPLLGDDFFLYFARMELNCKFKKVEKVLQSGFCVSGQTIQAAIKRINRLSPYAHFPNRRIIVNIGSVDIMQGKTLVQIEHDYRNLINTLNRRGLQPILTTLAPLANYTHDASMKQRLERFNDFIKREGKCLLVIDIWARFVNEKKQTLFDCYQNEPRQVTGAREHYVFWNKIGRQRVLQLIESNLEY